MRRRVAGWLGLLSVALLACGVSQAANAAAWPNLDPGETVQVVGSSAIPENVKHSPAPPEGDCADWNDSSGKLAGPLTIFFSTSDNRSFAVVVCTGIHSAVTTVYERADDGIEKHSFVKTYGAGYFVTSWLADIEVADPRKAFLSSYDPDGTCDENGEDFNYTYVFKDGRFLLIQVESRNCIKGSWKTIFEVKE